MSVLINCRANPYYKGIKSLDGSTYTLRFHWNVTTSKWYMDIIGVNNDVETRAIALCCGKDLLAPYGYYQLGQLWVIDNSGANEDPNYDDIGGRWSVEYTAAE